MFSRYDEKNRRKKAKRGRRELGATNIRDGAANISDGCSTEKRSGSVNGVKYTNGISNDTAESQTATIIEKKGVSSSSGKSYKKRNGTLETQSSILDQDVPGAALATSVVCNSDSQYPEARSCVTNQFEDNEEDRGGIIISRVEDIPTQSENPRFINIADSSLDTGSDHRSESVESCSYTKLKFEINFLNKKPNLAAKPLSTFAELSNKLGPTVNLNSRKLPPPLNQKPSNNDITSNKSCENGLHLTDEKEKNEVKENGFVFDVASANTVAEDMDLDDEEEDVGTVISLHQDIEEDEVVILKTSRSRSISRSRSRSRRAASDG